MSISSLTNASNAYSAFSSNAAKSPAANADPGAMSSTGAAPQPSSIVSLSVGGSGGLSATPLSVAWAPQLFSQADINQDKTISSGEFADQLKRVGISADDAKKIFDSFDTSKTGMLSIDDYVKGVTAQVASGNPLFSNLTDSYVRDSNGNANTQALNDFLSQGLATATAYAKASGIAR